MYECSSGLIDNTVRQMIQFYIYMSLHIYIYMYLYIYIKFKYTHYLLLMAAVVAVDLIRIAEHHLKSTSPIKHGSKLS